jgi:hypothetical protein
MHDIEQIQLDPIVGVTLDFVRLMSVAKRFARY